MLECWNRRDAAAMASLFADDGNIIGFDGSQVDGQDGIRSHLSRIFSDHPTAAYVGKVREVRFLAPEVAILRAVAGMVPPGQSD
ncbi:MAG: SgcJ/EcaC family oxidoreductase, partial [Thermoproteota archaeon]